MTKPLLVWHFRIRHMAFVVAPGQFDSPRHLNSVLQNSPLFLVKVEVKKHPHRRSAGQGEAATAGWILKITVKRFLNVNHLAFILGMLGMCFVANTSLCVCWHPSFDTEQLLDLQLVPFLWTFCSFSNSYTRNELVIIMDGILFSLVVPSEHPSWW